MNVHVDDTLYQMVLKKQLVLLFNDYTTEPYYLIP